MILTGAAWSDVRCGKVRNTWLLLGIIIGICCEGVSFLAAAGVMFLPVFILFRFRLLGAGDGKLMMVIAGYLGFWQGVTAIWTGFLIGAMWSICRFRQNGSFWARLEYFCAYFMRLFNQQAITAYEDFSGEGGRHRIPLAACLAAGVYLYLFLTRITGRGMG